MSFTTRYPAYDHGNGASVLVPATVADADAFPANDLNPLGAVIEPQSTGGNGYQFRSAGRHAYESRSAGSSPSSPGYEPEVTDG